MRKSHGSKSSCSSGSSYNLNELTMYLGSDPIPIPDDDEDNDLDLLAWWKSYETKFHVLSTMARDILTISVSTVASKQAFSASGHLIDPRRTMLSEETVETSMCLWDWYQAKNITQHLIDDFEIEDELWALHI